MVAPVAENANDEGINRAIGERWARLDPLLPEPGPVTLGCGETFRTPGGDGFAVCRHLVTPATSLDQTWVAATEYLLTPRLAGPDVNAGLDRLLGQWHEHVSALPGAGDEDTAVGLRWPSRDAAGVRALQRHGLIPMSVIAARPAKRGPGGPSGASASGSGAPGVTVRPAGAADLNAAAGFQLDVIRYDEQFGIGRVRPATEALVRQDLVTVLNRQPSWIWLAEDERQRTPVGLLELQSPERAKWIAPAAALAPVAYLASMFVQPGERGAGVGAALVSHAHAAADGSGAALTLLHYALVNPLSGPFWSRMGYRPLWTMWKANPAALFR
jgi:GNAT superfamily N-acetyltransferase